MLKISNIVKTYKAGTNSVTALKGVSMEFRQGEFVAILGASGCGKTTLLNIIGGLDRYDSGDLSINGVSTKAFKDKDWDSYRNNSIGFIFQSYNLISHLTVFQNVELSLSLGGVGSSERKKRVRSVLEKVGLLEQINKRPNQLSGGQMQRVAIARALVNDPDIILADEPTGALDSETSIQIMELIEQIAKERLVVMVTHNGELADKYSTRIITLKDGMVLADSPNKNNPRHNEIQSHRVFEPRRTKMKFSTALKSSFKNLMTKKGRTMITSIAGSIGIVSVALVLALSNGVGTQLGTLQTNMLSSTPITIRNGEFKDPSQQFVIQLPSERPQYYPDIDEVLPYIPPAVAHFNVITEEYVETVKTIDEQWVNYVRNEYSLEMNLLHVNYYGNIARVSGSTFGFQIMPTNQEYLSHMYDVLYGELPTSKNEVCLVISRDNTVSQSLLQNLGYDPTKPVKFSEIVGKKTFKLFTHDIYYYKNNNSQLFSARGSSTYQSYYESDELELLTVSAILRVSRRADSSLLSNGIAVTQDLFDFALDKAKSSDVGIAQSKSPEKSVTSGSVFLTDSARINEYGRLGATTAPTRIRIYPKSFSDKSKILTILDSYNDAMDDRSDRIEYEDMIEAASNTAGNILSTVTLVLIGFSGISLVVSSIMIGIITYVSVIERTKEIGVLRSLGARKKDIARIFNAETIIIGFTAGIIGLISAFLITIPVNDVILGMFEINGIATITFWNVITLIVGSTLLTLIGGFLPSIFAARKDPVTALRTEA